MNHSWSLRLGRLVIGACTLVAALGLFLGVSGAQGTQKPGSEGKSGDFEIIPLKNATAGEVARVLKEMLMSRSKEPLATITADDRSNRLIISSSSPVNLNSIRKLIQELDREQPDAMIRQDLRIFTLNSIEPDEPLKQALQLVLSARPGSGNFAVDPQRKQVIVTADETTMKSIEALLVRLDDRASQQSTGAMQVRVVWLASGPSIKGAGAAPADLKEVLQSLSKLSIEEPRLIAQTLVNVSPSAQFQTKGLAEMNGPCSFSVTGRVDTSKETPSLNIAIEGSNQTRNGKVSICEIKTEISAPMGHFVVLGVTPTESTTSVFVVQVLRAETKKK